MRLPRLTNLRNQHGFTLAELLIVVGIIGILADIALLNFIRFRGQARQADARANLGGIYTAQQTFFYEQLRYGSFGEIGSVIAGATNRYTYRTGAAGAAGGVNANVIVSGPSQDTFLDVFGAGTAEGLPIARNSDTGFTATAAANLDNDPMLDQWHINDNKQQNPDTNDAS